MCNILSSPAIIPVVGLLSGVAYVAITAWKKLREQELAQEKELRILEMEHRERMKSAEMKGPVDQG